MFYRKKMKRGTKMFKWTRGPGVDGQLYVIYALTSFTEYLFCLVTGVHRVFITLKVNKTDQHRYIAQD